MMDVQFCPRNEWIERFSARFRELAPLVSHDQSVEIASAAFQKVNDMVPEEVAVVFGEILDANVPLNDLERWLR